MKQTLIPLLLCAALLWGCAAQTPATVPMEAMPPATAAAPEAHPVRAALQVTLEEENDVLRKFNFSQDVAGFLPLNGHLLLFSGTEPTTLTLLDPDTRQPIAAYEPGLILTAENATVQLLDSGISYFDGASGETVVLTDMLQEIRRIPAPEGLTGMPLLSRDGSTLYYCTSSAVRAMDLDSRISRVLKEASYPVQSLSGLLLADSVLQLSITDTDGQWRTLFLSSENGRLLQDHQGNLLPKTGADTYLLQTDDSIYYGQDSGSPMLLHPRKWDADVTFLPDSFHCVSSACVDGETILELYDLASGCRTAELIMPFVFLPKNVMQDNAGNIWFMALQETPALYCWNPSASTVSDSACYSADYYTQDTPDYDALAACSLLAGELSRKYGIEILIYRDAAETEPWDYHLEYEYRAEILRRELENLDRNLSHFPEGFIASLADRFTSLKLCIVQSAVGSPESGNSDAVNGIQFMDGFDAYIVLATDHDTEYALYHELSHLMETVVLTESTAYDRWDQLNPEGFQYDNDYAANRDRDGSPWLQPGKEYFIDTYSMSYAKEDRARLLEYAMTSGHEERFHSVPLQQKLRQMCLGIREAFDLEASSDVFLWEQYLDTPLSAS